MKIQIRILILSMSFLTSCNQFSKSNLLEEGFNPVIAELVKTHRYSYTDGCLKIFDINETNKHFGVLFQPVINSGNITVEFNDEEVSSIYYGPFMYKSIVDPGINKHGHIKLIMYSKLKQTIILGYANSLL